MLLMASQNTDITKSLSQLETSLDQLFVKKAPFQLPTSAKDLIVAFLPWLTLIFAVMAIPLLVIALGLSTLLAPIAALGGARSAVGATGNLLAGIPLLVAVVLELMAVKGLLAKQKSGWNFAFYASLASILSNVLSYDLIGAVIGAVISWYFLFQIRSYYK